MDKKPHDVLMALLKFRIDMNPFSLLYFSCIYDTQFRTLKEVQKSQYYGVGYENGLLIMFPDEYISKSMPKSEQACLKLVKNMIFCFKSGKKNLLIDVSLHVRYSPPVRLSVVKSTWVVFVFKLWKK